MKLNGYREHYCGEGAFGNLFDAFLILVDTLDILLSFFIWSIPGGKTVLILRLVRILRLARLFKIFQAPVFRDLVAMVHALIAGMPTLLWSIIFFVCFLYVAALIFRAGFGPTGKEREEDTDSKAYYFQTVPRAMLTTFRCSFGDCSTLGGTPIFEFAAAQDDPTGNLVGMAMSCLMFISSIGLFNIISAVFLERVMAYASDQRLQEQRKRMSDRHLWHKNMAKFIDIMVQLHKQAGRNTVGETVEQPQDVPLTQQTRYFCLRDETIETLASRVFSREIIDEALMTNSEVVKAVSALDIDLQDCVNLGDTLDQDNDGRVQVEELIMGINRMRGPARRSDIVAVDLMMRSIQSRLDKLGLDLQEKRLRTDVHI